MGSVIAILFFMARIIISIHIKAISFLIKRIDVTNGLIAGSSFNILTANIHMNVWVRIVIAVAIIIGSILLQHFFKPARIVFGILSSFFLGLIAYAVFQENTRFSPFIPMGIAFLLSGMLNVLFWVRIGLKETEAEED
jgi:hypothetical protein